MKKTIYFMIAMMGLSAAAFAQQVHIETTGGYMKNTNEFDGKDAKKLPGMYMSGLAESSKYLVTGSLSASGGNVFGGLSAYSKVLPINGGYRTHMIAGAKLETTPTTTQFAPSIGFRLNDGWNRITDHHMITTLQPIGLFNSKVNGKTYNGYSSDVGMSAQGTLGDSNIMVQMDMNIGVLFGGSQKIGQNEFLSQKGAGMTLNGGMMFGCPVSDNWAIELGFGSNSQLYKVLTSNGTKETTSSGNSMVKIGIKGRIPVKVKSKVAAVL